MNQSEQINEIATALSKAQSEIFPAVKDSTNPFFKSKYADLASVWKACQRPLTKNGLSIVSTTDYIDKQLVLVCRMFHTSGQWMGSVFPMDLEKMKTIQGVGSWMTYLRRYLISAMTGVTVEDDDGQSAMAASNGNGKKTLPLPVNEKQAEELKALLEACDDAYQANFWQYLKKRIPGITSMYQLPMDTYEQMKGFLLKKLDEQTPAEKQETYA